MNEDFKALVFKLNETANSNKDKLNKCQQKYLTIYSQYIRPLVYAFGFYPRTFESDIEIKKALTLAKVYSVSDTLELLYNYSQTQTVRAANGTEFTIFNVGTHDDNNSLLRAVHLQDGAAANGHSENTLNIYRMALEANSEAVKKAKLDAIFNKKMHNTIDGFDTKDLQHKATELGKIIRVISNNNEEKEYIPCGMVAKDVSQVIYIATIYAHAMGLLPIDHKEESPFTPMEGQTKTIIDLITSQIYSMLCRRLEHKINKEEVIDTTNKNTYTAPDITATHKNIYTELSEQILDEEDADLEDILNKINELKQSENAHTRALETLSHKAERRDIKFSDMELKEYSSQMAQQAVKICVTDPLFWMNYRQRYIEEKNNQNKKNQ